MATAPRKHIEVRSARNAEFFRSERPWAAISITSGGGFPSLSEANRVGLLRLVFDDITQPDAPRSFTPVLAAEILEFAASVAASHDVFFPADSCPTKALVERAVRKHPVGVGLPTVFHLVAGATAPVALAVCLDPLWIEQTDIGVVLHRADWIPFAGHCHPRSTLDVQDGRVGKGVDAFDLDDVLLHGDDLAAGHGDQIGTNR